MAMDRYQEPVSRHLRHYLLNPLNLLKLLRNALEHTTDGTRSSCQVFFVFFWRAAVSEGLNLFHLATSDDCVVTDQVF